MPENLHHHHEYTNGEHAHHSHHHEHSHHSPSSHSSHAHGEHTHSSSHSHRERTHYDDSDRAFKARTRKARKTEELKKAIRKVTYRKEAFEKEKKSLRKNASAPKAVPTRTVPMVLYLEGLFALLLVFSHTPFALQYRETVWYALLLQTPVPALYLLLGYRIARRTKEVESKSYDKPYFSYILFPSLSLYLIPWAVTYVLYLLVRRILSGSWGSFAQNGIRFLSCDYGQTAYFGLMALQLILLFPLIFIIKKQTDEFKRKRKKKKKKESNRSMPWPAHIAGFVFLYELFVNWVAIPPSAYRLIAFRMLFPFALGAYLYQTRHKKKSIHLSVISVLLGAAYLIGICILLAHNNGFMPTWMPIFKGWAYTNFVSCLYFAPPIALLLYVAQRKSLPPTLDRPLRILGKASYYIIVVQAAYFALDIRFAGHSLLEALVGLLVCTAVALLLYALSRLPLFAALQGLFLFAQNGLSSAFGSAKSTLGILWCRLYLRFLQRRFRRLTK